MSFLKVFVNEYFGVMVCTSSSLFAVAVHVIPAKFPHNVFVFALSSRKAKSHVEIGTTFVNMPEGAVLSSATSILNKILTNFQIMTEVAPLTIRAFPSCFKLFTSFDFAFVMGVRTGLALTTLPMDELFADTIVSKLGSIVGGNARQIGWVPDSLIMLVVSVLLEIICRDLLLVRVAR